jgi:hypothetical protein
MEADQRVDQELVPQPQAAGDVEIFDRDEQRERGDDAEAVVEPARGGGVGEDPWAASRPDRSNRRTARRSAATLQDLIAAR